MAITSPGGNFFFLRKKNYGNFFTEKYEVCTNFQIHLDKIYFPADSNFHYQKVLCKNHISCKLTGSGGINDCSGRGGDGSRCDGGSSDLTGDGSGTSDHTGHRRGGIHRVRGGRVGPGERGESFDLQVKGSPTTARRGAIVRGDNGAVAARTGAATCDRMRTMTMN